MIKKITMIATVLSFMVLGVFAQPSIKDGSLQELPQIVDFELFNGVNLSEMYPGWQEGKGYQQPEFAGGAWFNGDVLYGTTTASVIFSTAGLKDEWIISPQFEVTETTKISFKAALTRFWDDPVQGNFAHNDSVSVIVSTNTEQFEFVHNIHTFKLQNQPSRHLEMYQFDLSEFAGQLIHLAFYATNGQEANSIAAFHLDDIEIKNAVPRDAMPMSLVSPTPNQCLDDEIPVIAEIRNDGTESISAVPVRVRARGPVNENVFGVYQGTLLPGETAEFVVGHIEGLPKGEYTFSVTTELADDGFEFNDHLEGITISNPEALELPLPFMNFMGFYSNNLGEVYPGWYEARGKNAPLVAMNVDWQGDNLQGERTASVYFSGLGTEDWMVGPTFTATENLAVQMKAGAEFFQGGEQMGDDDRLAIMVSADCGATWEEAAAITHESGLSTSLQDFLFHIPQYAGQDIILAFYATTGDISNPQNYIMHITDIDIKNQFDTDAGVTRLIAPGNSCAFGDEEEVVVEIQNFGLETISNFEVAYSLNDEEPVTETVTQSIEHNETLVFTFSSTIDLTQQDENTISVYTLLEDDQDSSNDGLMDINLTLSSFDLVSEGEYTMSFEEDEDFSAWLVEDGNNDGTTWELHEDPVHARTGDYSYAYFSNQTSSPSNDWLFSPCFYLQEGNTYYVSFYYKNRATNFPESLKLEMGPGQNQESMNTVLIDLGTISNSNYEKAETTFTVTESGEYYLGWHAYGPQDQFGMHIDDVTVYQVFDQDLAITNFFAPRNTEDDCSLEPLEEVHLLVSNPGADDFTGIDIDMVVDQGTPVNFTFDQTLEAGESVWLSLENGFSLDPDQYYHLAFYITSEDDQNSANDVLVVEDFLHANYTMGFEDYEDFDIWTIQSFAGTNQWHVQDVADLANSGQNSLAIRTDAAGGNDANDDWAITGCFELSASKCYEVSFSYRSRFSTENLAVYLGTDNDYDAMDELLIDLPSFSSNSYLHTSQQFTVQEDGTYYFGWHTDGGTSGRFFIFVDDIAIVEDADAQPVADPQVNVIDTEVEFFANAENASFTEWDFGDGNTSEETHVFHVYETPGTYDVTLTLGSGCVDVTYELTVTIACEMEDDFDYVIDGTTVTFTATGDAAGYEWDFGDGNSDGGTTVVHTYQNLEPQTFEVTMTGFYSCGSNTEVQQVFIEDTWEEPASYILTLVASPEEGGIVSGDGEYDTGSSVVVAAIPNDGFVFVNWTDDAGEIVSTQAAFSYTMPNADVTLTAHFEIEDEDPELYTVTITNEWDEFFTVSGEGEYEAGNDVTVEAIMTGETGNMIFVGWYEEDDLLSEEMTYTFVMPERDVQLRLEAAVHPFVEQQEMIQVTLFPNPANEFFSIEADKLIEHVIVTDITGKVILRTHAQGETSLKVSLEDFQSGIYFVAVYSRGATTVKKLNVNR